MNTKKRHKAFKQQDKKIIIYFDEMTEFTQKQQTYLIKAVRKD